MRCTTPEIKAKDAMLTSEVSIMLIKGANPRSKVAVAHVMEVSVLQTTMVVMVDNAVPTKKWSNLEATFMTISAPT
jgi:hypothetical protein